MPEEAIPLKHFQEALGRDQAQALDGRERVEGEPSDGGGFGVGMECCNSALLEALEQLWDSPPSEEDGSDSRSLAHRVSLLLLLL